MSSLFRNFSLLLLTLSFAALTACSDPVSDEQPDLDVFEGCNEWGSYLADSECVTWTRCTIDEYVVSEGTSTQDTLCAPRPVCTGQETDIPECELRVELVAGAFHFCVRGDEGRLWCWGGATSGTVPDDLGHVSAVGTSRHATVAIGYSWSRAWGFRNNGELDLPEDIERLSAASGGEEHVCAVLRDDGTVRCWGSNEAGQLDVPEGLADVVQIDAGGDFTCALDEESTLHCWGTSTTEDFPVPAETSGVADFSVGLLHMCAIMQEDRRVECFGSNFTPHNLLNVPEEVEEADDIAAGGLQTCALATDGEIYCWGRNVEGEGERLVLSPPEAGEHPWVSVVVSQEAACALDSVGGIACWGESPSPSGEWEIPGDD